MALRAGRPYLVFGTPGGDVQTQTMLQVLLNVSVFGMDLQEAIEQPRFATFSFPNSFVPHTSFPGLAKLESRFSPAVFDGLRGLGHTIEGWGDWAPKAGAACAILLDHERRLLKGAADPRRPAYAVGW